MDRREFIEQLRNAATLTTAAGLGYASAAKASASDAGEQLKKQIEGLEARMDDMDEKQKKVMRAVMAVALLSTGIDISLLL